MTESIQKFPREQAPQSMRDAAARFEDRYHVHFDSLTWFPADTLEALHVADSNDAALMRDVFVATEADREALVHFDTLTHIANVVAPSLEERADYFAALQAVYHRTARNLALDAWTLVVAPEREGRILAEVLGWLRPNLDLAPHAKRIPYDQGLLIGLALPACRSGSERIVLVDGAIASGATMIALLNVLGVRRLPIDIYSVHSAREGLRALLRFGAARGLSVRIHVGHVTDGLCARFYAVDALGRLVVGDLGDMIDAVAAPVVQR